MAEVSMTDVIIIVCPPVEYFKEQLADQSLCTIEKCRFCDKDMWLSEKKKSLIKTSQENNKEILLWCYPCLFKESLTNENIRHTFLMRIG